MVDFNGVQHSREIVPDWMEEQLPGYIADDGTYDHDGFIAYLQSRGYSYALQDSERICQWGVQLGQCLKIEDPIDPIENESIINSVEAKIRKEAAQSGQELTEREALLIRLAADSTIEALIQQRI